MDSKSRNVFINESSIRPQFNVGGQVSVLRNSLPSLASTDNPETTQFLSWATSSRQTTTDFHSELAVVRPQEKKHLIAKEMSSPHSRSLNPEMLMREFMHDDSQSEPESPTSGFKSSFAREVMQNVRKNEQRQQPTSRRYLSHLENSDPPSYPTKDNLVPSKSGRLSMPTMPSRRSSNKLRAQMVSKSRVVGDDDSDERDDGATLNCEEQWMSSSQFKALLDNQETLDNFGFDSDGLGNDNMPSMSYLDQDAKIPFRKLKQTCDDLGFSFTETEWSEMRRRLSIDTNQRTGDDLVVRNGDFFAAVHFIMSNKHNRNRRDEAFKYSMKSDSGGEMESCRSSDSELERELHEKEREIQQLHREVNTGCRSLAERDTELFRIRLECQRLLEDNRSLREQLSRIRLYGPHSKRQIELEQEVDQLRWKLVAMEDSRRTYESATERLVMFLEQVTTMLQATSPSQRKFVESTRAEVSKIAKRAKMQNSKRLSLDSSSMFRAESMPGLNSSLASSSGVGMLNKNFHGSLLSLSTSVSGGDAGTTTSSGSSQRSSHIQRRASSSSASAMVQRSQSTHSKRSNTSTLPSVRERRENPESIYVNSDIIREFIAEETTQDEPNDLHRPQSAAAILHGKRHVCEIKIGGGTTSEDVKKKEAPLTLSPAKRSNSVISSSSTATSRIHINSKASKILGLDPQQPLTHSFMTADSGRFSLSSRTSSPSAHSSPLLPLKLNFNKKSAAIEDEIQVVEATVIHNRPLEKSLSVDSKLVDSLPVEKPRRKSLERIGVGKNVQAKLIEMGGRTREAEQIKEPKEESLELALKKNSGKLRQKSKDASKDQRPSSNPPVHASRLCEEDRGKFKSLGDLYIEKGLPVVPTVVDVDVDVDEDKRQLVIKAAHSLMRGVRSMMTRDKTLTITPKKPPAKSLSSVGLNRNQKPPQLQLLSHTSFPGLPTYPVLAASHSSPWNC